MRLVCETSWLDELEAAGVERVGNPFVQASWGQGFLAFEVNEAYMICFSI